MWCKDKVGICAAQEAATVACHKSYPNLIITIIFCKDKNLTFNPLKHGWRVISCMFFL